MEAEPLGSEGIFWGWTPISGAGTVDLWPLRTMEVLADT